MFQITDCPKLNPAISLSSILSAVQARLCLIPFALIRHQAHISEVQVAPEAQNVCAVLTVGMLEKRNRLFWDVQSLKICSLMQSLYDLIGY